MLLISKSTIQKIVTMKQVIQVTKQALLLASAGGVQVPLRTKIKVNQDSQFLFKPAYIEDLNTAGIKIVSVFPSNAHKGNHSVQAQMLLLDAKNGTVQALIDGTYLTQLRTGALQGAATDLLARKDAKIAVLIGTGGQATSQLEALLNVRPLREVRICGTNYSKTQRFVKDMQQQFNQYDTNFIAVEKCNDAIPDADIITAVTTSKQPVFDGKLVKKGAHINGMGSYMPEMQELPEYIITAANKVFFDTKEGVLAESGDFIIPLKKELINNTDSYVNLGDLLLDKVRGRRNKDEITLFKSVGTAVLDVATAFHIYYQALAQKAGITVDF